MHYMVNDFELDTVRNMRDEALRFMGITPEEFNCSDEFWSRQNIRLRMREGMMADKIQVGDEILFINAEPLAAPGDFRKVGGRILSVDAESVVLFCAQNTRAKTKRDKAVVSASRHNCLKHRPAEPFGMVLFSEIGAVFGAVVLQWQLKWAVFMVL